MRHSLEQLLQDAVTFAPQLLQEGELCPPLSCCLVVGCQVAHKDRLVL